MREIAVRLFINEKYAGSFGNMVFNRAAYNGSIELHNPMQKYLVDFYGYTHWENRAQSDAQMQVVRELAGTDLSQAPNILMSWILHWDKDAKTKVSVPGFCAYLQDTHEMHLRIEDPERDTKASWDLPVRHCKNAGPKLPVLLATNVDLTVWQ
jgi:hypothetical protein